MFLSEKGNFTPHPYLSHDLVVVGQFPPLHGLDILQDQPDPAGQHLDGRVLGDGESGQVLDHSRLYLGQEVVRCPAPHSVSAADYPARRGG